MGRAMVFVPGRAIVHVGRPLALGIGLFFLYAFVLIAISGMVAFVLSMI